VSDVGRKKNPSAKKKLFFSKCFEKKMNDKRNLICGNVMLLSQSHDETSLFVFCKNSGLRKKNQILIR